MDSRAVGREIRAVVRDDPATPEDETIQSEMGRGGLEVRVSVGGTEVMVLTAHLKSKLISYARLAAVEETFDVP